MAGNSAVMLDALAQVKPIAGPRLKSEIADATEVDRANRILDMVKNVKGRFAQELAELLADGDQALQVPVYLREAIEWVTEPEAADVAAGEAVIKASGAAVGESDE
ncbi:hypothetical protein [Mycobacterium riyadhense]|uniref:hypothetical protein n=1 Tax=Mycobacterium riyadhense TaxID=486698 RepID=UPI00194DC5BD|nr:hypothetical protein [Mycobacterium riyadhense]